MTRQSVWCVAWFLLVATLPVLASCSHPPEVPVRKAEEGITLQRKPSRQGMDLVRNEQNAQQLRRWMQRYVDPTMHELLDVTLTVLLSDLEIFRLYVLCYTMDLLPTRDGNSATAPKVYYLGHTELASVLDLEVLSCKILCTHFQTNGVWQMNDAVQQALRHLWQEHEVQHSVPEKIVDWLNELKKRAEALALPLPPGGQSLIQREHLKKAFQAVVYHYIAEVKVAKGLG